MWAVEHETLVITKLRKYILVLSDERCIFLEHLKQANIYISVVTEKGSQVLDNNHTRQCFRKQFQDSQLWTDLLQFKVTLYCIHMSQKHREKDLYLNQHFNTEPIN